MNKTIPLWALLLCLLLGMLFTTVFGAAVESRLVGDNRAGIFGDMALRISSFPEHVEIVFTEITSKSDEPIRIPRVGADLSGYRPVRARAGIDVTGLVMRADMDAVARASGWRMLVGAFTIDGELKNAALALSPELEIAKVWIFTEDAISDFDRQAPHRKFIHGFAIMSDGSVIFSFDGGVSLQRFDRCGSLVWATGGRFHHAVTLDENEEYAWSLLDSDVVKVATATGEIVRKFSMDDIVRANPSLDILAVRTNDDNDLGGNSRNTGERWQNDPFHLNDVDPLPAALADKFEGFEAGDLLISARSLNLVFIVDPDTLDVKWWRSGAVRRQHDPDWGRSGDITVYDNRMGRDYSRIVSIGPKSFRTEVLLDGRAHDFYSRIRGKHMFTGAGNLLVTSPQQGRVFEVAPGGETLLEIFNLKPGNGEYGYALSQADWFPTDTFNFGADQPCAD